MEDHISDEALIYEILHKLDDDNLSFPHVDYSKENLIENNYVLTRGMKDRLDKLYAYISKGIPIIIEGEIATSKTFSAEIICKYIGEEKRKLEGNIQKEPYIKYRLNSDVKIPDLIKKLVLDNNYFSGIKIVEGPLYKAFKNGIPLILEGINIVKLRSSPIYIYSFR